MSLIYNATFDKNTRKLSFEDRAGNEIYSFIVPERGPAVDKITKPLTFKATQNGSTVKLTKSGTPTGDFQTSTDGGNTWSDYTLDSVITLNTGDEVSFRAKADRTTDQNGQNYFYFMMEGKIEAWHNVMSMYRISDFATYESVVEYGFCRLFYNCTSLTKAPELPATTLDIGCYHDMFKGCTSLTEAPELPATTLANSCYSNMFSGCQSLTKAPELPATTLSGSCYSNMFSGCQSLTKAPELPATTLTQRCYQCMFMDCTSLTEAPILPATTLDSDCYYAMFNGCTSLTKAPELPVTTLAQNCYDGMFWGCTSLTKSPELPATTLANFCYNNMFKNCTSLTEAPVLPATTLAQNCYQNMFSGCTSLTKAPELPATTLARGCYSNMFNSCRSLNEVHCKIPSSYSTTDISSYAENWLSNVSATGTFYTNADANWPSGASGIPEGWTRVNERAKDDVTKPLTFKATQDGSTVTLTKYNFPTGYFQTSRDGGNTWTNYTYDTAITLSTGDEVSFRAENNRTSPQDANNFFQFKMTGKIEAWHNVMSLYRTSDFATYESVVNYAFSRLFSGCTSLTKAPELPATTLARGCYSNMFIGCTSLTEAPVLPATTLANYCYQYMFNGCTSLTKAPVLSATSLADSCYQNMFNGCSSLNEVRCQMPSSYTSSQVSSYANKWLKGVSSTGTFYTNEDANWPSGANGIPEGWTRIPKPAPTVNDKTKPLTFRATQNGSTVTLKKLGLPEGADFQTSRDGGSTWTDYTIDTAITLNTDDEVSFRAKADREFEQSDSKYFQFNMTGKIEAWHNVMSLYRTNDFATYESVMKYAFYRLFYGCTSLTKAPVLPATTLASDCYRDMFRDCTSLTEAPYLPSTTPAQYCYKSMFLGCTSLTKTPNLQATRLGTRCYWQMFEGCSSLNEVHCYIPSSYSTENMSAHADSWLYGVSSTGTFYTNADANWSSGTASGIPEGWTRVNS